MGSEPHLWEFGSMYLESLSKEAGVQAQHHGIISCLAAAVLAAKPLAAAV